MFLRIHNKRGQVQVHLFFGNSIKDLDHKERKEPADVEFIRILDCKH
jgi:hypothetical protein